MRGNEGCRSVYAIIECILTYNGFACQFSKSWVAWLIGLVDCGIELRLKLVSW